MSETISMYVERAVPKEILARIYRGIDQDHIGRLLEQNGLPSDDETREFVSASYEKFPTRDLALKAAEHEGGVRFWGIASGSGYREARVAVKYLVLEYIQDELAKEGIPSEINIAGLNPESIEYMKKFGLFKGRLTELRRIARRRGNIEDLVIGMCAASRTPV